MTAQFWAREYDLFATEYGWSKKDVLELEVTEWIELRKIIYERRRQIEREYRKARRKFK